MKQGTNLILHNENYTSFVNRLFTRPQNGGIEGRGRLFEGGGAYFKFWLIAGAPI